MSIRQGVFIIGGHPIQTLHFIPQGGITYEAFI